MKKLLLSISLITLIPLSVWAAGSCPIEVSPPEKLVEYLKSVSATLSKVGTATSRKNLCDTTFKDEKKAYNGSLTSVNGLLDQIDLEVKLENGITTDFLYNIKTSFDGTAREGVIRQWQVIHDLEDRISSTIKMVASTCNLDTPVPTIDGRPARSILKDLLIYNRKLEYYFKTVAVGSISYPDGVSSDDTLFVTIASNYSPWATSSCKNEFGFEEIVSKLSKEIDKNWKFNGSALDGWKKAITLFGGENSNTLEYQELQKKLLTQELARQGVSQTAQDIMLGNLSCFQRNTNKESTVEESAKAKTDCTQQSTEWLWWGIQQSFIRSFTKDYKKTATTDAFLKNTLKVDTAKAIVGDVGDVWKDLNTTISSTAETTINAQILSDLVSMHMQLVIMNKLLKEKIPDMQKNCMKENPRIVWACK